MPDSKILKKNETSHSGFAFQKKGGQDKQLRCEDKLPGACLTFWLKARKKYVF